MSSEDQTEDQPSLSWRVGSSIVMGLTGFISRTFLLAGNKLEVNGLDKFLELVDDRRDPDERQRGLITVSNHLSILDDPLMWGAIPYKYHWNPSNHRWGLGSHDLMFQRSILCSFFSLGQVLPAHRMAHSKHGGPFQPSMTQAIRLLSHPQPPPPPPSYSKLAPPEETRPPPSVTPLSIPDPFTSPTSFYYYTVPLNLSEDPYPYRNPTYYPARNKYAWVHLFPEGRIHQHPDRLMRYYKWGVSRLILEAEPAPLLVPIWIEGFDNVMHESRTFPRFLPRLGKDVVVTFGDSVSTDTSDFASFRQRWRELVEREKIAALEQAQTEQRSVTPSNLDPKAAESATEGEKFSAELYLAQRLKFHPEAVKLREECTLRVREEVLKVRRSRGWADEDPKARFVDTWKEEGHLGKREGKMEDGSWVRDT